MKPKKGTWCLGVVNYADSHYIITWGEAKSYISTERQVVQKEMVSCLILWF